MSMQVTEISHELVKITQDGNLYLGIHLSPASRGHSAKQVSDSDRVAGIIARDREIIQWVAKGLVEHDGEIYLYGPFLEGKTLQEVLTHSPESGMNYTLRLAEALLLIQEKGGELPRVQTNSIIFPEEGGVFFFSPAIMERIRNTQVESERIATYELFNNPDLNSRENLAFSLAVITYKLSIGEFPFTGDTEEELHYKIRELRIPAPRYKVPELREDVSNQIITSLRQTPENKPSLKSWAQQLAEWKRNGIRGAVTDDQKESLLEKGAKLEKKAEFRYRSLVYFQQNWRVLLTIAVIVVVFGSIGGSILRNALKPRATLDLNAREVVELFYNSITELNHLAIEDCVTGDAGKAEINESLNLFVLTRTRFGQEGTSGFFPAQEWKDAGRPELGNAASVYGVAELKITEESETVFLVEYEKWEPGTLETEDFIDKDARSVGHNRKDRVFLEWDGKYWVIYQLDRLQDEVFT